MLFNSEVFLYAFLPLTLLAYYAARSRVSHEAALATLTTASLVYYGWWDVRYLALLLGSAAVNFTIGRSLWHRKRKWLLALGIAFNVCVLGFFKYTDFIIANVSELTGTKFQLLGIVLPIGISFITFQKIAFLADVYAGKTEPKSIITYLLFVTFFPQLIAGPIVHHRNIARQFNDRDRKDDIALNLSIGLSIFVIGLAKKVLIADNAALAADTLFAAAERGDAILIGAAWAGALSYAIQIFFDFSAYSDMAVGLGRMFGYHLPINFNAPYRASSIIDFWRRWHITLSHFLRDYLYIPLGGNRLGPWRRYLNLMIVMLVGGLWHGASWTFVAWGGLHGLYLTANHLWRGWRGVRARTPTSVVANTIATFLAVLVAWVFFRAATFAGAAHLLEAMIGLQRIGFGIDPATASIILLGLSLVYLLPDTPQLFAPVLRDDVLKEAQIERTAHVSLIRLRWAPTAAYAVAIGLLAFTVIVNLSKTSEFIYYQF